jgi:hypothetical protein
MTLNDSWTDLGDGYTCHVDGKNCSIRHGQGYIDTKIYSKVEDYSFDDRYVIAKQNPDYEYYKIFTRSDYCTRFAIYSYYLKDSTSQQFMDDTNPFIRQAIRADSSFYKYLKLKGVTDKNSVQDWEIINPILDSVFKTDPFYKKVFASNENYWIIDKDQNIRYGPLTFNEFDKLRDEKRIDLKFKNEK